MFTEALKQIRNYHNISQGKMAKLVGVSQSQICLLEVGKYPPSVKILDKYAAWLNVPLSELIAFAEELCGIDVSDGKKITSILKWVKDVSCVTEND